MLMKITTCLQERGTLSLAELSSTFETDPAAMEGMLESLVSRGRIERIDSPCTRCKGCGQIRREDIILYRPVHPPETTLPEKRKSLEHRGNHTTSQ